MEIGGGPQPLVYINHSLTTYVIWRYNLRNGAGKRLFRLVQMPIRVIILPFYYTFYILHPSHFLTQGRSNYLRQIAIFGWNNKPSSHYNASALGPGIEVHDSKVGTRL